MIEDLRGENLATLRELYRAAFANRPILRSAVEALLDEIDATLWGDAELTYTRTFEEANRLILPLLLDLADQPPEHAESAIAAVRSEWRRIASILEHP